MRTMTAKDGVGLRPERPLIGGAICSYSAEDLRIYDSDFIGNSGPNEGGAISAQRSTVDIGGCTFSENETMDAGGAIVIGGSMTIDNNTFDSNDGGRFGGGIAVYIAGSCRGQITNNSFTDNIEPLVRTPRSSGVGRRATDEHLFSRIPATDEPDFSESPICARTFCERVNIPDDYAVIVH